MREHLLQFAAIKRRTISTGMVMLVAMGVMMLCAEKALGRTAAIIVMMRHHGVHHYYRTREGHHYFRNQMPHSMTSIQKATSQDRIH